MVESLLRDLASVPRPTGSDAIAAARARCATELRAMGFTVTEQPFEFSEFVGRFATPLMGGAGAFTVGLAAQLAWFGARYAPVVVVLLGVSVMLLSGRWLVRTGVLAAPVLRRTGVNLIGTRAGTEPSVWLCAHIDTKAQPIPTLLRSIGIMLEGVGILLTLGLTVALALGAVVHWLIWVLAAGVTLLGAVPVVMSVVGTRSPGALDNASGVATMMEVARQLPKDSNVGVLITDGEELGLAGARAWVRSSRGAPVLNCDGVDDEGEIHVMYSGRRPKRVLTAVARAAQRIRIEARQSRLALGILTDSVACADAGLESVTFSRGSLRSFARVHTSRDNLTNLRGAGISDTAALIAGTVNELVQMTSV